MTKPRSTRIRKGVEVINNGRPAVVTRTTNLNMHGPIAELQYTDVQGVAERGSAMIADLVRADEVAELLPATVYATVRVDSDGKPLGGMFERKYRATDEARAAELSASNWMTRDQYSAASVTYNEDGVWTFTPGTGAPVHIRVTEHTPDDAAATAQEAAEQAEADEHEQQQLDAMGKHEETLAEITPPKYPEGTPEYAAYVAELIPELEKFARREPPYDGSTRSTCCGEPMSPENRCENCGERGPPELQTWSDVDVVARTEQLHPSTHPYRANEVVEYIGPSGIGSWVHGPMHFRRMVEVDVAEIMTMSGPQRIEVADLRRPASNIAVELTPDDVARLFQALAQEAERLAALGARDTHTDELRDRFAALHP